MDTPHLAAHVERLNDEQRAAVLHGGAAAPLLVLAAAGTGKTEVLTTRVARLVASGEADAARVLAVTFSNRAAREMRERAARLLPPPPEAGGGGGAPCIATFHSACLRLLRSHARHAGGVTVLDAADATQLLAAAAERAGLGLEPPATPAAVYAQLTRWRNDGALGPADAEARVAAERAAGAAAAAPPPQSRRRIEDAALAAFPAFRRAAEAAGAADFADLLCHAVALLRDDAAFLARVRARWTHVLVDEFQDTNAVQFELLRLLAGGDGGARLTVVGDDCQTIHEHAGACPSRILRFADHFPGARVVKLERNYRSGARILGAANALIERNVARSDKRLVATRAAGEAPRVVEYASEAAEAEGVARALRAARAADPSLRWADSAVLYRLNALSQPLEAALRAHAVPHRVAGGQAFFERAEVRDALAWLVAAANPRSAQHVLRALGAPPRGVGPAALARLQALADGRGLTLPAAAARGLAEGAFRGRAGAGLRGFLVALGWDDAAPGAEGAWRPRLFSGAADAAREAARVLERAGLAAHLAARGEHERAANVHQLLAAVRRVAEGAELRGRGEGEGDGLELGDVLGALAALGGAEAVGGAAAEEDAAAAADAVTLMSMHRSKGLEWRHVYAVGVADGVLPFAPSLREGGEEGERRLAYVAVTRARDRLTLSHPRRRAAWSGAVHQAPSRFLGEMGGLRPRPQPEV